jgi:hypothetical protein
MNTLITHNNIRAVFLTIAMIVTFAFGAASTTHAQQYTNYYYNTPSYPYNQYQYHPWYPSYYPYQYQYPYYPYQNYYYNPLNVSCHANTYSTNVGGYVTWSAYASGGAGYYNFNWGGSEYVPSINSSSVSVQYQTPGTKYVWVTVSSGGQTKNVSCGTVQVNGYYYQNPYPWYW